MSSHEADIPRRRTVLIVEDREQMRKIVKSILMHVGVRDIFEAANGADAWNMLTGAFAARTSGVASVPSVDLIVCDWMMPGMSGIELLKSVRAHPRLANTPFLMVTGQNDKEDVVTALGSGVNDYVTKPFPSTILESKLRKLLA